MTITMVVVVAVATSHGQNHDDDAAAWCTSIAQHIKTARDSLALFSSCLTKRAFMLACRCLCSTALCNRQSAQHASCLNCAVRTLPQKNQEHVAKQQVGDDVVHNHCEAQMH